MSVHRRLVKKQQGMMLIMLLFLIGLVAVAMVLSSLNANSMRIVRDGKTNDVLAEAKAALIGFSVGSSSMSGHLPNPDMHTGVIAEGGASGSVGATDISLIGKLPWRSLGLPLLKDGNGECLWYVVSGRFKADPPTAALNWDTQGQINLIDGNGNVLAAGLAALIVSSGSVLGNQNRSLEDDTLVHCAGNYDARNYLDTYDLANAVMGEVNYFSGSTKNSRSPNANNKSFILADNVNYNDRFLYITADEIFQSIIRRSDFSAQITALLDDDEFKPHLQNLIVDGSKGTANIDCGEIISNADNKAFCNNWKEMLLLAELPGPASIEIDGMLTPSCNRVLIFAGTKTNTQVRATAANISDPTNYLEGVNLTAFNDNTADFSGISVFDANNSSADIMRCL